MLTLELEKHMMRDEKSDITVDKTNQGARCPLI